MTREEKFEIYKREGWKYDPKTGNLFSNFGTLIKGHDGRGYITCSFNYNNIKMSTPGHQLAWFL